MDYRTFQANTMSAALAEVKHELGPQAVILHTRSFVKNRWLGLRRKEVFEITAGRGARPIPTLRPPTAPSKPQPEARRQLL